MTANKMWKPRPTAIRLQINRPAPEPAPVKFKTGPIVLVEDAGNELQVHRLEEFDSDGVTLQCLSSPPNGIRVDFDLNIQQQVMVAQYLIDNLKDHAVFELARLLDNYCPHCE